MRYPLDGNIIVTGEFEEKAQPGTGLPDSFGVRRHIGVDMRASIGSPVYAPGAGKVTQSYSSSAGQTIEILINGLLWRFMHLSSRLVKDGDTVSEGQIFAKSGNSGGVAPHLHVDVRVNGVAWNYSLNSYGDFRNVIAEANKRQASASTDKRLYFNPIGQTATFYKVSGGTFPMKIKDASYNWRVLEDQGYRVKVNSASAGGDCWVYIIYQTGTNKGRAIPGRSVR